MSDVNAEQAAEDTLIAAVMAPEQNLAASDTDNLDQPHDLDNEGEAEEQEEGEQKPEAKAKDEKQEAAETDEEDYVEIAPAKEGDEPTKLKVSELVASHTAYQQLKGQQTQILERVEREATEQATQGYRQIEQYAQQTGVMIQATLQLLQPPLPPNADQMLNPASQQYDPDGYHRQYAHYTRAMGQFQQAQTLGQHLLQQAQGAQARATELRETQELQRLQRVWPEFGQQDTVDKFISEMGKAYGYTPDELDASMTDHRNALVARDALAYRAMKAKGGDVKKQVEAKAPKLVRSKQEAKGGAQARDRDGKGQFVSGALADLKKTNSEDAAVRYFAGLSKAGRI